MSGVIQDNFLRVLNPISGKEISSIEVSSQEYIDDILEKSQLYTIWENLNLDKRCDIINKFRKIIVSNRDSIEKILKSETEKTDNDIFIEMLTSLEHLKEIVKIARDGLKKERRNAGIMKLKKAFVKYEPIGVVGIISPWNYPIATPLSACVEALLAGNNVVLKPSEHTPLTISHIKELWDKYIGFNDAFNIIIGGPEVGNQLVVSDKTDLICFTGSSRVGRSIAEVCGKMLKPVILELGGKDPMIILEDADIDRSVDAAIWGGLSNAGQTCISVERIFAHEKVYPEVVEKLKREIQTLSSGKGETPIGAISVDVSLEKIRDQVSEAKNNSDVFEGNADEGRFIPPCLVVNPPFEAKILQEETFGPVMTIHPFQTDNDAIELANKTGYGLSASIFGKSKKRIAYISRRVNAGAVAINDVLTHYGIADLPFGGKGISGMGKVHGKEGLRAFSYQKSYMSNWISFKSEFWWYKRSKKFAQVLRKWIKWQYS